MIDYTRNSMSQSSKLILKKTTKNKEINKSSAVACEKAQVASGIKDFNL